MQIKRCIILMIILLGLLLPSPVLSQELLPARNVSLVLVIDSSGSMSDADPGYLRRTAAKLFVSLLDPGDEVGFVEFSSEVIRSQDMISIGQDDDKSNLLNELDGIVSPYGGTNMAVALSRAGELVEYANPQNEAYIILLTDGDPDDEGKALSAAKALDVPIVSIGLSRYASMSFLQTLANLHKGGEAFPATNASDLPDAYLQIFGKLTDRNVITLKPNSNGNYALQVQRVMIGVDFVVVQPGVDCAQRVCAEILKPGGSVISALDDAVTNWQEQDFAVVSIEHPITGSWQLTPIAGRNSEVHAIVKSRLRIKMVSPASQLHPLNLPMVLITQLYREEDDGRLVSVVGEPQRQVNTTITRPDGAVDQITLYDNGEYGDFAAGDGNYTNIYSRDLIPGEYSLVFESSEADIPVVATRTIIVEEFPVLTLVEPLDKQLIQLTADSSFRVTTALDNGNDTVVAQIIEASYTVHDGNGITLISDKMQLSGNEARADIPAEEIADLPVASLFVQTTATAEYKGILYKVDSQSAAISVNIRPSMSVKFPSVADFGDGFSVSNLRSLQGQVLLFSSESIVLKAEVVGIPWLEIQVRPSTIIPRVTTDILLTPITREGMAEAPGDYSGRLVLSTTPQLEVIPTAEMDFYAKLSVPTIMIRNLTNVDLGIVDNMRQIDRMSPITFTIETRLPEEAPLEVKLLNENDEEIQTVRPLLSTPSVPSTGITAMSIHFVAGAAMSRRVLKGDEIAGRLVFTSREGVSIQAGDAIPFRVQERSRLGVMWQGARKVLTVVLFILVLVVGTLIIAELVWATVYLFIGRIPDCYLAESNPVRGGTKKLSDFSELRHRVFGVAIAPPKVSTDVYYCSGIDQLLGWLWTRILHPRETDIKLRSKYFSPTVAAPTNFAARQSESSSAARIIGRRGEILIANLDHKRALKIAEPRDQKNRGDNQRSGSRSVDIETLSANELRTKVIGYNSEPYRLEGDAIIYMKDTTFIFRYSRRK